MNRTHTHARLYAHVCKCCISSVKYDLTVTPTAAHIMTIEYDDRGEQPLS